MKQDIQFDYVNMYGNGFSEEWDTLVDWPKRRESENRFFQTLLKEHGCKSIIDMATGTGFHSIEFLREGFRVISVDGSEAMLLKASENAFKAKVTLDCICSDWRTTLQRDIPQADAIVCLGNSFTHLFSEEDRHSVIKNWRNLLKENGIIIVDYRNYEALLDNQISKNDLKNGRYLGEVDISVSSINKHESIFSYTYPNGKTFSLRMFPLTRSYMESIFTKNGFSLNQRYTDFTLSKSDLDTAFFTDIYKR